MAYSLRFISGKYQGGEFPLSDGEVLIGRSSELDMVLIEDMVSRKHAKIACAGDSIQIFDLGSTNGTFVNGEKVKRARLKEGDRLLIGTNILKLVPADVTKVTDARAAQRSLDAIAAAPVVKSTISGSLDEVPVIDLLQLFSTGKKTGALLVAGGKSGKIHLRAGKIVSAVIDQSPGLSPRKALFRLVTWESGTFEFVPAEPGAGELSFPNELTDATDQMLLEAFHEHDELKRAAGSLPPTSAVSVSAPLVPPLRALTPAELDLVQLAWSYGGVQALLDRAGESDLEALRSLRSLIERGYLRAL